MTRGAKIVIGVVIVAQIAAVVAYLWVESGRATPLSTKPPRQIEGVVTAFKIVARDGTTSDLVHGDKPILVHFWATWCPPCIEELPLILALPNDQVRVVAIALDDDWEQIDAFAGRDPKVALANREAAEQTFEIASLPQTVLMAPDGQLLLRANGARNWADPDFFKLWTNPARD